MIRFHFLSSADFRGQEIDSFIDGSKIRFFPSKTRQGYILQSVVSIVSLVVLVVGVVASIYVIRLTILESDVRQPQLILDYIIFLYLILVSSYAVQYSWATLILSF